MNNTLSNKKEKKTCVYIWWELCKINYLKSLTWIFDYYHQGNAFLSLSVPPFLHLEAQLVTWPGFCECTTSIPITSFFFKWCFVCLACIPPPPRLRKLCHVFPFSLFFFPFKALVWETCSTSLLMMVSQ